MSWLSNESRGKKRSAVVRMCAVAFVFLSVGLCQSEEGDKAAEEESFQIKKLGADVVLASGTSPKNAVEEALAQGVSLNGANLSFVDLRGTNFSRQLFIPIYEKAAKVQAAGGSLTSPRNIPEATLSLWLTAGIVSDLQTGLLPEELALLMDDTRATAYSSSKSMDELMGILRVTTRWLQHLDYTDLPAEPANLSHASLTGASLEATVLFRANLTSANMMACNLRSASLVGANLQGADLSYADVAGADFYATQLAGCLFAPSSLPDIATIAWAEGLDDLRYLAASGIPVRSPLIVAASPSALLQLKDELRSAGFRDQSLAVACSIKREEDRWLFEQAFPSWSTGSPTSNALSLATLVTDWTRTKTFATWLARYLLFDITCKYGADYVRPMNILFALVLFCGLVYTCFFCFARDPGLLMTRGSKRGQERTTRFSPSRLWGRSRLNRLILSCYFGFYLSMLTCFRVGFRDFNLAVFLEGMQCKDYSLRTVGPLRFVTGIQCVMATYMIALAVLTYFGEPFG